MGRIASSSRNISTMHPYDEARFLALIVGRSREYSRFYFSLLKGQDPHRVFVCEGKPLNSLHLTTLCKAQHGVQVAGRTVLPMRSTNETA
jgi:hypothetical protein